MKNTQTDRQTCVICSNRPLHLMHCV